MKATPFLAVLAAAVVVAPAAAQVKLNGAGATFPAIIYQEWITTYNKAHSDVELNYQSIGSGGGIQQFTQGTVDFGASDAPMSDVEIAAAHGNVLHFPTVLGAVLPTYNIPGVTAHINFTPDVLADIYLGKITKWNDPRLVAINKGLNLPNRDIAVVHRSDGSGTTYIFTDYLTKVSESWHSAVGTGKSVNWPVGLGAKGNEGVSASVSQTPGAIGYVELGYALINHLTYGSVRNKAGHFIVPSITSVTAAAAGAMAVMGPSTDFRVSITNPDGADAYPISSFTWLLVHKTYDDASKAGALIKYVWWSETTGQARCAALGYAPLPQQMQPWIEARLKSVTVSGRPVWTGGSASR
jgi:phosphate transport system substrate-binding protein